MKMNTLDLTPHIWIDKVFGTMSYGYKEVIKQRLNLPNDSHIEYIRADVAAEREKKLIMEVIEFYEGSTNKGLDWVYKLTGLEKLI